MSRRYLSLFLVIVLNISLLGCSNNINSVEKIDKSNSVKVEYENSENTKVYDSDNKDTIILTDSLLNNMYDYISKYQNMHVFQELSTFAVLNSKKENVSKVSTMNFDIDLYNRIILSTLVTSINNDGSMNTYYFADDNLNNIHLSKVSNNGSYIASDDLKSVISIDYNKVRNCGDLVNMLSSNQYPLNIEGYKDEDNHYTFELVRDANSNDLSGINYNRLGKTTIIFKINYDKENVTVKPFSIEMSTTYFVGQVEYGVSTYCEFSNFSNEKLEMPDYVKAEN